MALAASAADREVGELEVAVVVEERVVTAAAGFPSELLGVGQPAVF